MLEYEAFLHCPRCATVFTERTSLQSHCAQCGFTMYHSPKQGIVVVLRDPTGRLGLSRRAVAPRKGAIDPVGGFVEQNETLEACGVREMQEEIGLAVSPDRLQYFGSTFHPYSFQDIHYNVIDSYFVVDVAEEEKPQISIKEEVASFDWYDIKSIDSEEYFYRAGYDLLYKTFGS